MMFLWMISRVSAPKHEARDDARQREWQFSARTILLGFIIGVVLMLALTVAGISSPDTGDSPPSSQTVDTR